MASVTWKGEPGPGEDEGPKSVTWGGKVFKRGEAVEVEDPNIIAKAKTNPYFEVSGDVAPAEPPPLVPAPSQMPAPQHAVPKPGEPVKVGQAQPLAPKVPPRV
jgi:hypothetical protein